ncbi:GGDEF domain-containing protein [Sphaerotilus mobilis]|uniref:Diguanylate cyclase (GGDEF)-like protein n=1 Tax=Sphaerotilus mobilis TaxID=47994 RepID=A0A4Q7L9J0_9BURK|nr:GGDEF domain-containing protein [Sphaerotilus mobilis]RZS46747.1 diguanylate cyclase (GGDEF)-like protein [Sphaerotilus mobilis]
MTPLPAPVESDLATLNRQVRILVHRLVELEHLNAQLRQQAHHDLLTGLPNRRLLADRLGVGMARARRSRRPLAVCCLDLDGFKAINDQHGHAAGDVVLVAIARRLEQIVRAEETVARVGGDEFVLLLDLDQAGDLPPVLARVRAAVQAPVDLGWRTLQVSASVGHVFYPGLGGDDVDGDTLLRQADRAMYRAKNRVRDPIPRPPTEARHALPLQVARDGRGPDDLRHGI